MTSTYAASPKDIIAAIILIRSRTLHLKEMITHRLKLKDAVKGFQMVAEAKDSIKVIIEP